MFRDLSSGFRGEIGFVWKPLIGQSPHFLSSDWLVIATKLRGMWALNKKFHSKGQTRTKSEYGHRTKLDGFYEKTHFTF